MGTLEAEMRLHLSRLTQNKVEHEDLWDFGENDGLDDEEFDDSASGTSEKYQAEEYKLKDNRTIVIEQQYNKNYTGSSVWHCCRFLCELLENRAELVSGKNVIELGAGHGLASILISMLGGKVTATDVPVALDLIQRNISGNNKSSPSLDIRVEPLDWGKPLAPSIQAPFDIVVASDCIYNTFYHVPLCDSIDNLTNASSKVIIAYGHRGLHQENFISTMTNKGFIVLEKITQTLSEDQIASIVIFQKQK